VLGAFEKRGPVGGLLRKEGGMAVEVARFQQRPGALDDIELDEPGLGSSQVVCPALGLVRSAGARLDSGQLSPSSR
jgi:hypothetical protein